jgi:hypothetical protein
MDRQHLPPPSRLDMIDRGGGLFHAAGQSADGWTIIAVHDSREGWERFRDSILIPRMTQGIAGGFTAPPEETGFEIYNEVTA